MGAGHAGAELLPRPSGTGQSSVSHDAGRDLSLSFKRVS